jgi:hypothetical protein
VLRISQEGEVEAALNDQAAIKTPNPEFLANAFFGTIAPTERPTALATPATRLPKQERFDWDLRLTGDRLRGVLYVSAPSEGNGYVHPYWVTLTRIANRN